jgi:hypothetical protein
LFSKKCFKCKDGFTKNDLVMRANNRIYHVDCFRCCMCNKQLAPGDEFALKEDGLLCKMDNDLFEKHASISAAAVPTSTSMNPTTTTTTSTTTSASTLVTQSAVVQSTSCQNITNLQGQHQQSQQANKTMLKCEDLNATNEYEGESLAVTWLLFSFI